MSVVLRIFLMCLLFLVGCEGAWNDPYGESTRRGMTLYSSFPERPKHLDPVQSYTEDEARFTQQIYEPLLQYHYLKRPYELIPLTTLEVPKAREIEGGKYTVYDIRIRPGILYQPHPAFVAENLSLDAKKVEALKSPYQLPLGTRELVADDYINQIKRLAHPRLHSPIGGHMNEYIVGLADLAKRLKLADQGGWLDLRAFPLEGVERVDSHTFRIKVRGSYPQFVYWLAMPFFAPVPWEAEKLFSQPGMAEKNFTLDWWPVGTGPYMLTENDPNSRMVLERNPNFRGEPYPSEGEPEDRERGLLADAGKTMPFVDRVVYSREKESIPYWNKFLQGYYDSSGIGSDQFDQAVRVSIEGDAGVTPEMEERGVRLSTSVAASIGYVAFNWDDSVVGGSSERARKLRQAISIAFDIEEQINIFANGRGIAAQGPVAPGIFGYRDGKEGINTVVYDWVDGKPQRKSIEAARKLLAEAGYPNGRDARTGQPLVLYLDTVTRGPGDKASFDWYRRQFEKLSIQLEIRSTDWNRFQEKIRKGATQLFRLGWNADYPDPENFLFLLYGPQSRAKNQGENASNYRNAEYDALFERMKNMPNSAERQRIIDRMAEIARRDAAWIWGTHPKEYSLRHSWLSNDKPNNMARNNIKYLKVDTEKRAALRAQWNKPILWPIGLIFLVLVISAFPAILSYRKRERMAARPA
ncbi:MAG: peptide/nickel transport system substrate-binding protein [Betaproteobacteria bacterium]|jgi:ABC-type transport system substrate-binding protein|nr:peptide/nickel transport system substrate-binding protein [Betaproteobacteria bacterium]